MRKVGVEMSGIYISGIQLPKWGFLEIRIYPDGRVTDVIEGYEDIIGSAVPVPDHGDLIDRVAFRKEMDRRYPFDKYTQSKHGEADAAKSAIIMMLADEPTVIPGDGENET